MPTCQVSDTFQCSEARGLCQVCGGSIQSQAHIRIFIEYLLTMIIFNKPYIKSLEIHMFQLISFVEVS